MQAPCSGGASILLTPRPQNLAEARRMVRKAIEIQSQKRPNQTPKYKTPDALHRAL